jgi:hypothetical protein
MALAVAPAIRIGFQKARTEVEPPVTWNLRSGFAECLSLGGAATAVTCSKGASSSSARIVERAV